MSKNTYSYHNIYTVPNTNRYFTFGALLRIIDRDNTVGALINSSMCRHKRVEYICKHRFQNENAPPIFLNIIVASTSKNRKKITRSRNKILPVYTNVYAIS